MTIALRAVSTGPNSNATSTTISLPTGTTTNDLTIITAVQGTAGGGTLTPPSGWTTLYNAVGCLVCYRVYQAGDPSSVTFTSTASMWWETAAASYSGVDTSAPIDQSAFCSICCPTSFTTTTKYRAPSVCPTYANDQLVAVYGRADTAAGSAPTAYPSGFTQRALTTGGPCVAIADKALTTAAATGTQDATWTALTGGAYVQFGGLIALKTAGDTPVTPAAANVVHGGLVAGAQTSASNQTIDFSKAAPRADDLIVIALAISGGVTVTPPSGYTLAKSQGPLNVYYKTLGGSDTTAPVFALSASAYVNYAAYVLRRSGSSTTNVPGFDAANGATGTQTATLPALTPAGANELALYFFGDGNTAATSWTASPAASVIDVSSTFAPSLIAAWDNPPSSPTPTLSATVSNAGDSVGGVVSLFALTRAATPPASRVGKVYTEVIADNGIAPASRVGKLYAEVIADNGLASAARAAKVYLEVITDIPASTPTTIAQPILVVCT
ncbi:hypothetical protein PPMP20_19045 [Paraburkholderia phymatum]|uniref:Uncharacterized protein n=1 Tax=Paraburkholderia phymatum (strain DSM 17167 / CIP 108236 / LMG 21445 / STM815) TaxID=391038 RepID=B2JUJ1_PARP8|nr:hypothetical protein [Paraburkholderia phymatum]ACC76162.1 hypothetical protein Bphy_7161 [Paraburkholderia phymatum STM815]